MAKAVKCARCGRENDPTFCYCLDCGQSLQAAPPAPIERLCAGCGAPLAPEFRFCGHCGRPVDGPAAPQSSSPAFFTATGPPPLAGTAENRGVRRTPSGTNRTAGPRPAGGPRLTVVRPDGQRGAVFPLAGKVTLCGRTSGEALLPEDLTVSPRHAQFTAQNERVTVEDLGSVCGTFVRLRVPHLLAVGEEIRLGRQLLRLEPFPRAVQPAPGPVTWGSPDRGYELRLSQLLDGGGIGEVFPLKAGESLIGRESGEVTFPFDRYVSGRHARIDVSEGLATLTDLGSSNGTFVRITSPTVLQPGDQLLIGAQLMYFDA